MGEREKAKHLQGMGERERLFDLLIHDLREPLAIVSTSTSSLLKKGNQAGSLAEDQKRGLERILRNVQKAQNLLQEMIEIFHSEEGLFQKEFFSVEKTLRHLSWMSWRSHSGCCGAALSGGKVRRIL
jgi:signal transduction histidine kinase